MKILFLSFIIITSQKGHLSRSLTQVLPYRELPKSINFPLYEQEEPTDFSVIVFGDPQPYSMQDLDYFTEKIIKTLC